MKKAIVIILIIAVVLLGAGGYLVYKGYKDGAFAQEPTITKEYTLEDFDKIDIDTHVSTVTLANAEDGQAKAVCEEREKMYHNVKVEDNTLVITQTDDLRWYEHIFGMDNIRVTIYLPKATYESLKAKCAVGNLKNEKALAFNTVDVNLTTGNAYIKDVTVAQELNITGETGNVKLENVNADKIALEASTGNVEAINVVSNNDFTAKATTGNVKMDGVVANNMVFSATTGNVYLTKTTSNTELKVTTSTGNIRLDQIDAVGEITLKASTGSVKGTIASNRTFFATSSSGSVKVPQTLGPICRIETSTGSISIEIAS